MSYTALYRRFRPQRFAELVGQEHISRTLAAAIREGCFVHAYLFSGPRGTGKTSAARIMSRAVNCLEPTAEGEPCGLCPACLRSAAGEALDILEIDGASNRGIDEIRDLRERVKYAPALEKYKVYIIDEVHMLTSPAFNALLKTLEEPPPQVLFILATTEPHKMPLTVLSRCQRFDFRRIADSELIRHLTHVAGEEGYTAEPEALALIARKAEGGMRDALGLLDQCAGFNTGQVTVAALNKLTGMADAEFIAEMTRQMLSGDAAALLTMVANLYGEGRDLRQFLHDLLEYQRELLLQKLSPNQAALPPWAQAATPAQLLKLLQALADGDSRLKASLQPRLTLELALLAACENNLTEPHPVPAPKPEQTPTPQPASKPAPKPAPEPKTQPVPKPERKPEPEPKPESKPEPNPETPHESVPESPPETEDEWARFMELWPKMLHEVRKANAGIGAFLENATPLSLQQQRLTLSFATDRALFMDKLCRPGPARDLLEQKIFVIFGAKLSVTGLLEQAPNQPPPPTDPPPEKHGEQGSLF